jgi:uncharacterized phage protein gp47/JayE
MTTPRSQKEYYDIGKNETQIRQPALTDFNDGSINDIIIGVPSVFAQEITRLLLDKFKKTMFASADNNDLENLAVDHFGDAFARPKAQKAIGIVKFSRPNALGGDVFIDAGSIVKTTIDANGNSQRYETLSAVTLVALEINASVRAMEAGIAGNVLADEINVVETSLTDPSIIVTNEEALSGGAEEEIDAEYRETIKRLIQQLAGATLDAIRSTVLNVSGVEYATAKEFITVVKEWDESGEVTIGDAFRIPRVKLYIADANGTANDALIDLVKTAVAGQRAAGVYIEIKGATAISLDWTANITLNPAGPNYATLQSDTTIITDSMRDYIENLDIGESFIRVYADAAIMALWGPSGTNDLTNFQTQAPAGDIDPSDTQKIIPGDIETV